MVEGHQCHRVAAAHRRLLVGKAFQARSPNGRFKEGAAAINAKPLQRIEVHGKNLFYFFGGPSDGGAAGRSPQSPPSPPRQQASPLRSASNSGSGSSQEGSSQAASDGPSDAAAGVVVMHVHFGMSGAFKTMSLPGPDPTETTRLELINREMGLIAHLSAMTVAHGSLVLYQTKAAQLGPDPLREDADKEVLWAKLPRCRKPIGLVLMDQSMMAGVGNIYRAEILFKAGVHPETPASAISREQFDKIWYHSVDLLQRGFVGGSIVTVDPEEARVLGKPWTRRYIYNQRQCGRCKGPVRTWDMAARTVYCCETCQPLRGAAGAAGAAGREAAVALTPARAAAMAAARPARVFVSHCAPDDPEDGDLAPDKLTVKLLRERLLALNLDTRGNKPQLVKRLEAALRWQRTDKEQQDDKQGKSGKLEENVEQEGKEEEEEEEEEGGLEAKRARAEREPSTPAVKRRRGGAADASPVPAAAATPATVGKQPGPGGQGGAGVGTAAPPQRTPSDSATTLDMAETALAFKLGTQGEVASAPAATDGGAAGPTAEQLRKQSVAQLRSTLRSMSLPVSGAKEALLQRILAAHAAAQQQEQEQGQQQEQQQKQQQPGPSDAAAGASPLPVAAVVADAVQQRKRASAAQAQEGASGEGGAGSQLDKGAGGEEEVDVGAAGPAAGGSSQYDIRPGTQALEEHMASAKEAALEKLRAGENRAVEHVALEDDDVVDLLLTQRQQQQQRRGGSKGLTARRPVAGRRRTRSEQQQQQEEEEAPDHSQSQGEDVDEGEERAQRAGSDGDASRVARRRR